jgi:hypothetical protein
VKQPTYFHPDGGDSSSPETRVSAYNPGDCHHDSFLPDLCLFHLFKHMRCSYLTSLKVTTVVMNLACGVNLPIKNVFNIHSFMEVKFAEIIRLVWTISYSEFMTLRRPWNAQFS